MRQRQGNLGHQEAGAREMVSDDSAFATVIFGEGVTEEQAAEVENLLLKEK